MDLNFIKENTEKVKESQRKRYESEFLIDLIVSLGETWTKAEFDVRQLKTEFNKLKEEMGAYYKKKEQPPDEMKTKKVDLELKIKKEEAAVDDLRVLIDQKINGIGNLVHKDVPVSMNEDFNTVVDEWGEKREHSDDMLHHHELLYKIGGYEPEAGSKVAGARGYFLTGPAVMLNQAIINYAMNFLTEREYSVIQTPFFMNKEIMARTAQLSDFDEQLYKVSGEGGEEKYLIATSEQPLSAFNMGKNIPKSDLPIKYAGYSTNFRKEAGGHGRDVWGIFRVHQFEKIEQFCITAPEKSWEMHQAMIDASKEFFQSLNIPYRVVDIVSGELNDAAARKYDLEGWYPCLNEYRELVSCSNCTDYQSRKLDIKFGFKSEEKEGEKYVHMLNSTLAATSRVICAILENGQQEDGVHVPEALHPYLPENLKVIPYVREVPAHLDVKKQAAARAKGKGKGKGKKN